MIDLSVRYADAVFVAAVVHPDPQCPQVRHRAFAVTDGYVVAIADRLEELTDVVGPQTRRIELSGGYVLPGFDDTHTHLMAAADAVGAVELDGVGTVGELLRLLRLHAKTKRAGQWILTGSHWQELNLAERRLPTRAELDSVSTDHPILVTRGGHNAVANSLALAMAQVGEDVTDMPGGRFGRDVDGRLDGRLLDNAVHVVSRVVPAVDFDARISAINIASRKYAASGITTVRDCYVAASDLTLLKAAYAAGALHVRMRVLVGIPPMASPAQLRELLDSLATWHTENDDFLRVWGVKFVFDGGLEAGATIEPYRSRSDYFGLLTWDPGALEAAIEQVLAAGWKVGVHAYGDRAVEELLSIFARVRSRHPQLADGSLVIEHAGLTNPEQRRRVAALGVAVTIQQPLLHDAAHVQQYYWGRQRTARLFPARSWMAAAVTVAAGSDYPVGKFGAMRSVWGLTTRRTVVGVLGASEIIDRRAAIVLHTTEAARLLNEHLTRGRLWPGHAADFTVWPVNPYHAPTDELKELLPVQTWVGGVQRA
ncbi:amidohydrolase [Mycobacteroides abscessus]|uniref:amidohydrolase n=1 Tax=Mycobacteroides abscessus TaxID=36809 RepID=UPI0018969E49|nr:amidohydrolase [Mycobacteroides abscessus]